MIDKQRLERIRERLVATNRLNHAVIAVLDTLDSQACFSPDDLWLLEQIEQRVQVRDC